MLMALLLGIALHFLAEEGRCAAGIDFTATAILRLGVALLGARISVQLLIDLGVELIALIVVDPDDPDRRRGGQDPWPGLASRPADGGAVAICGASAAMAIAAVLPKNEHSERNLIFTVLGVTVLSTVAMVLYPVIAQVFGLDDRLTGVFLGGTIHDVAQVVGAGFTVSEQTGETATLVKLIRVVMLAPVVLVFALSIRTFGAGDAASAGRPPLVPGFVLAFLGFAVLNSVGAIPAFLADALADVSRWALLVAVAAVGMKTSLRRVLDVGGEAILLIVAETVFVAALILAGVSAFNL